MKPREDRVTRWVRPNETLSSAAAKLIDAVVAMGLRLARSQLAWTLVVVVCVSLIYFRVAPYLVTQGQVYSTLYETHSEMIRLRSQPHSQAEWTAIRIRTCGELAELVPVLEQRAVTDDKTSMSLLWLARDYLPRELNDSPPDESVKESKVQEHFRIVQQELIIPRRTVSHGNWWIRAIVGLDVVGGLALLAYWVRM